MAVMPKDSEQCMGQRNLAPVFQTVVYHGLSHLPSGYLT